MVIETLFYFTKVAQHMNITKAADELDVSKSVVSRALKELESTVGVSLIERNTRNMRLTDEGQRLYAQLFPAFERIETAFSGFQSSSISASGTIRLSGPVEFSQYLATHIIPSFRQLHPDIEVLIQSTPERKDLVKDKLDLVIRSGLQSDSSYHFRKIVTVSLKVFASQKFAPKTTNIPINLVPWVRSENGKIMLRKNGDAQPQPFYPGSTLSIADNLTVRKNLILNSDAVTLLPAFIFQQEIDSGLIKQVYKDYQSEDVSIYFLFGEKELMPIRTRLFIEYVCEHFEKLSLSI